MDILDQIREQYDTFSKTRRRICDFILTAPEQCCFCSLKSFAQRTSTTEVTVLNFCRAMGLDSYLDLKKALQDYVIRRVNPGRRLNLAVAGSGTLQELHNRVCRAERDALQTTLEHASLEHLSQFCSFLKQSRHIFIAAHDASRVAAYYLHHRLTSLGMDCRVLDLQDRRDLFTTLSCEPEQSLLVVISVPPYGAETVSVAQFASSIHMPVAAITDRPEAPAAQCSDVSLFCRVELMGMTNSYTPILGMIDLLTMLHSFLAREEIQQAEEENAALHQQFESCFLPQNELPKKKTCRREVADL